MGLFSRKQVLYYYISLYDCAFKIFDDIASPFFSACKLYNYKLSREPDFIGHGIYLVSFMNGISGRIILKNDGASIELFREFSKDTISEEPGYREALKKIYLATMEELTNEYSFTYAALIRDDKGRNIACPWEITPKKTYM